MRARLNDDIVAAHGQWLELWWLHEQFGRGDSIAGYLVRANLSRSYFAAGQLRKARMMMERDAPGLTKTPMLTPPVIAPMWTYAELLLRMRETERAKLALRAVIDDARKGGNQKLLLQTTFTMGRALAEGGDLVGATQRLEEGVAIMRSIQGDDPQWHITKAQLMVPLFIAQGRYADAGHEVDATFTHIGDKNKPRNRYVAPLLMLKAQLQLAERHPTEALASAQQAFHLFSVNTLDAKESADVGEAQLLVAQAQAVLGDARNAATSARSALGLLRKNYDAAHPLLRTAIVLAAESGGASTQ